MEKEMETPLSIGGSSSSSSSGSSGSSGSGSSTHESDIRRWGF